MRRSCAAQNGYSTGAQASLLTHARKGDTGGATKRFTRMFKAGRVSNVATYNTLPNAYAQRGDMHNAKTYSRGW